MYQMTTSMSSVLLPQHVGPGRLEGTISLTKDDLRITIDKLRNALSELARVRYGLWASSQVITVHLCPKHCLPVVSLTPRVKHTSQCHLLMCLAFAGRLVGLLPGPPTSQPLPWIRQRQASQPSLSHHKPQQLLSQHPPLAQLLWPMRPRRLPLCRRRLRRRRHTL
mgnify:CR=1 FL=1